MNAVDIHIKPLPSPGREAEKSAVAQMISEIFGPDIRLEHNDDGSPYVDIPDIEISISHCRTCAVLATGRSPLGVDVETDRAQLARVAPRVLSPAELDVYSQRLVEAWTLKEALYKAAKTPGLDFRRDIQLPVDGSDTATVLTPQPVAFKILKSEWLEQYSAYISLVCRL